MSIACWRPVLLLFFRNFSSIEEFTMPSFQLTTMFSSSDAEFAVGKGVRIALEFILNVGGRAIERSGDFGKGRGRAPLGPDQVPYSMLLIFAK